MPDRRPGVAVAIKQREPDRQPASEHFDVLILGAGLSGIGAACHLRRTCPGKSLAILEARDAIGGTWDLFRYPGIRSDSDMFTMGYSFRPWEDARGIADGPSILSYIRDTASAYRVDELIRFGHRAVSASWSSEECRWTVTVERADGEELRLSCSFLYMCTGYYRYDEGYNPAFEGSGDFAGTIVHPQHWPEDLDCKGKRVLVIGSGATAVTLVPSLVAEGAAHVTMLQRSPTYIVPIPALDGLAARLRGVLPPKLAYAVVRWRNVVRTMVIFQLCRRAPGLMRKLFKRLATEHLPAGYDVQRHFTPTYNPWDQRVCLASDGDFFEVLSDGSASIVTAEIDRFNPDGVRLEGGETLAADVIVTATGLQMLMLGGLELTVDGEPIELGETVAYKGLMLCGIPNLAFTVGYTNASWTLKADLVASYVCRLLRHMDATGTTVCTPRPPRGDAPTFPIMDLKSGYVLRAVESLPKQGERPPWRLHQNYIRDIRMLRHGPVDDELDLRRTTARERRLAAVA
jgi:cation diffusion facilitator CzcD-associated flavoprotein CzcO